MINGKKSYQNWFALILPKTQKLLIVFDFSRFLYATSILLLAIGLMTLKEFVAPHFGGVLFVKNVRDCACVKVDALSLFAAVGAGV